MKKKKKNISISNVHVAFKHIKKIQEEIDFLLYVFSVFFSKQQQHLSNVFYFYMLSLFFCSTCFPQNIVGFSCDAAGFFVVFLVPLYRCFYPYFFFFFCKIKLRSFKYKQTLVCLVARIQCSDQQQYCNQYVSMSCFLFHVCVRCFCTFCNN